LSDDDVRAALWRPIERINERLEHYEQIRKIGVLQDELPAEVRSVNVFQKIKIDRQAAAVHYAKEIDAIYAPILEGEIH
jgi:long-subunit acyl-CoA synthetase (AMP-forming)